MGFWYKENVGIKNINEAIRKSEQDNPPLVVCSLGDASVTEGEISEAFQMAALKQLPILYLVQDNGWDISANAEETRAQDAFEYARGFNGLEAMTIDCANFTESYEAVEKALKIIREERRPVALRECLRDPTEEIVLKGRTGFLDQSRRQQEIFKEYD